MKAASIKEAKHLSDIPNIGPAMVRDLKSIGIKVPKDLKDKDGYALYKKLCKVTSVRQDPCVLDTFLAAVDFAQGAPARPWFYYTKERKEKYGI
jgi:hypothetical protein